MDASYSGGGQMMAQSSTTMGGNNTMASMGGQMVQGQQVGGNTQGSQPNYALATSQRIPGMDDGKEKKMRRRRMQDQERNTSAEEKEFASLTTKKNLCNVQNKLERAMADLNREVRPTMLQEGMITTEFMDGPSRQSSKGSMASRTSRRSSFGSDAAMSQAKHMADVMQSDRMNMSGQMMLKLNADIIDQRQRAKIRNPIERGNLRDLLKIDDRLDPVKIANQKYKAAKVQAGSGGVDILQEKKLARERRERAEKKLNLQLLGMYEPEDDDRTPSPIDRLKNATPRMRHMISYRCQNEKETRNH